MRIRFCNPFGTDAYDDIVRESLEPYLRAGTEVEITHLDGCPRNIDYYLPKHLMEVEIFRQVRQADRDGVAPSHQRSAGAGARSDMKRRQTSAASSGSCCSACW